MDRLGSSAESAAREKRREHKSALPADHVLRYFRCVIDHGRGHAELLLSAAEAGHYRGQDQLRPEAGRDPGELQSTSGVWQLPGPA